MHSAHGLSSREVAMILDDRIAAKGELILRATSEKVHQYNGNLELPDIVCAGVPAQHIFVLVVVFLVPLPVVVFTGHEQAVRIETGFWGRWRWPGCPLTRILPQ